MTFPEIVFSPDRCVAHRRACPHARYVRDRVIAPTEWTEGYPVYLNGPARIHATFLRPCKQCRPEVAL